MKPCSRCVYSAVCLAGDLPAALQYARERIEKDLGTARFGVSPAGNLRAQRVVRAAVPEGCPQGYDTVGIDWAAGFIAWVAGRPMFESVVGTTLDTSLPREEERFESLQDL